MMWRARLASSRTVILLAGSGSPLELPKVDFVRPSSRARLVMKSAAKIRSLPAMPSASAMQESLPLWMIAPCSRSSTDTLLLRMANMVEPPAGAPPLRQAFSLIRYSSVSLILPSLMALKTTSTVISFIMLEGARNSSALFSNSTLPLDASIRIAVGASPSKPPSSFFGAPCTLLLAAYTIPPHPIASAMASAIRPRHGRMAAAADLRETEVSTAIGDVLSPCVLTVGRCANNTGLDLPSGPAAVSIGLRHRTKERIVAARQLVDKIRKTGRKRDAILTHHFRQRAGLLCRRGRTRTVGSALPRLARTILFLAAPDRSHRGSRFPCHRPRYARVRPDQRARRSRRLHDLSQRRRYGRAGGGAWRKAGGCRRP